MKKIRILIILCILCITGAINAQQQVSNIEARNAAINTLYSKSEVLRISNDTEIETVHSFRNNNGDTLMYEVVFENGAAVLLSGSKASLPVLGYYVKNQDDRGSVFDTTINVPCCLRALLNDYAQEIEWCFAQRNIALSYQNQWDELQQSNYSTNNTRAIVNLNLTTKWGQWLSNDASIDINTGAVVGGDCPAYNYHVTSTSSIQCSKKNCGNRCPLGCAAVAMGQVMNYWKYPMTYDWCNMPNMLNSYESDYVKKRNTVAKFLKDCADAASTSFCIGNCSSSATLIASRSALVNDFNYSKDAKHRLRSDYLLYPTKWKNFIKTDLNNGRPVIYGSVGVGDGHWWVIDGYDDSNDKFQFKIGHRGKNDGWYTLDNITINPHWNISQEAIFEIYPSTYFDFCNYNLEVNSTVMASILLNMVYPTNLTVNFNQPTYNTINPGQNVTYKAHNSIIIKPGFRAAAGSNFRAHIEPCAKCPQGSPSPAPQNPNVYLENENEQNNIPNTESSISVFPNPTTGIVNIISQNAKIESISVFDISGKVLENNTSFAGTTLDLSWLSNGIYFIKIKTLSEQVTHKVIIQK